jgi:Conserved protein/domain typically associated with flavoprotein oxygenases, DIM6/NTAB family
MNASCAEVGPEVDEFALAKLTPAPSRLIKAPRVAESPVSFECRLTQLIKLQTAGGGEIETWVAFGEVVAVYIDKSLLKDGIYDTVAADPISRGGGPADYFTITEANRFQMYRPGAKVAAE